MADGRVRTVLLRSLLPLPSGFDQKPSSASVWLFAARWCGSLSFPHERAACAARLPTGACRDNAAPLAVFAVCLSSRAGAALVVAHERAIKSLPPFPYGC